MQQATSETSDELFYNDWRATSEFQQVASNKWKVTPHSLNDSKEKKNKAKSKGCEVKSHRQRWHYLAVRKPSELLKGITSKLHGDFYRLNCFHSVATENKCESHKKVCENKDFCNVIVLFEDNKILEFNQHQKSDKGPFAIYADLECLVEKIDECKNNPQNSFTKVSEHIPSGFSISTI